MSMSDAPIPTFKVGEQVRISDGPFASFNGVVEAIDGDPMKIAVSIFARPKPVQVEIAQVQKLD
jgi:transcriptional antiterminator NusG